MVYKAFHKGCTTSVAYARMKSFIKLRNSTAEPIKVTITVLWITIKEDHKVIDNVIYALLNVQYKDELIIYEFHY